MQRDNSTANENDLPDYSKSRSLTGDETMIRNIRRANFYNAEHKLRMVARIDKDNEKKFLIRLNSVMDPNIAIPNESQEILVLRSAVYKSGHNLEQGMGFANLEKIGFCLIREDEELLLVVETFEPVFTPQGTEYGRTYNGISDLFVYLAPELLDDSSLWYFTDQFCTAMAKENGELVWKTEDRILREDSMMD